MKKNLGNDEEDSEIWTIAFYVRIEDWTIRPIEPACHFFYFDYIAAFIEHALTSCQITLILYITRWWCLLFLWPERQTPDIFFEKSGHRRDIGYNFSENPDKRKLGQDPDSSVCLTLLIGKKQRFYKGILGDDIGNRISTMVASWNALQ